MDPTILLALTAFAVIFGGGMLGFLIGNLLHERHRSASTERVVQSSMRTLSLLSALVLGLLVATAKNKFDANNSQIEHFAADLMFLNAELVKFGPDTDEATTLLRKYTVAKIADTWKLESGPKPEPVDPPGWYSLDKLRQKIIDLAPDSEYERSLKMNSLQIVDEMLKARWVQVAQQTDRVPQLFLWVLMGWLAVVFVGFGLFAPRNMVTFTALLVCAASIAIALAMIDDLDTPWDGLIIVSPAPMLKALDEIGSPSRAHTT